MTIKVYTDCAVLCNYIFSSQVRASDQGTPIRTAFASLTINVVTGAVSSPPTFDLNNYNAVIREDASISEFPMHAGRPIVPCSLELHLMPYGYIA